MSEKEILTCSDCEKEIKTKADKEAYEVAELCAKCYSSQKDSDEE